MYLIVGLGNPEPEYSKTRHNMGFNTINQISNKYNIKVNKSKFKGLYAKERIEGKDVILLKPQTFMNLSGICIREFINFFKIDIKDVIVIYDEIQVAPGKIRIRTKGSSGGHNGMKSIIENLGTEEFARIRIGIGSQEHPNDMINYVIGKIDEQTCEILEEGVTKAKNATIEILKNGIDSAMNKFN